MINVNRDWTLLDTTPIGTVITTVQPSMTAENVDFEFGLEHGNGPYRNEKPSEPLPFTINEKTGQVSTNQSLINMVNVIISYLPSRSIYLPGLYSCHIWFLFRNNLFVI